VSGTRKSRAEARDPLADKTFREAAAQVAGVARVDDWVGEVFAIIADIAVGDVEDRNADVALQGYGVGEVRCRVNGVEQGGFAGYRDCR
jgi:hypothetical protein